MERKLIAVTLTGLTTLFVVSGCAEPPAEVEEVLRPIRSTAAEPAGASLVAIAGVTKASLDSRLSFRVAGTIDRLQVGVGDRVGKGKVLARLDPADFELEVERARASLAQVEALQRQAAAEYDRVRGLYENDNASKSNLDTARANADTAGAQVTAARKALEQAERQLSYTTLRAPESGAVAAVLKEVNEIIGQGETLLRLTSDSTPEVELGVAETMISSLTSGMPVEISVAAIGGQTLPGRVYEVGVATAEDSATYPVTIRFDQGNPGLRSGMAAEVRFRLADRISGNAARVPQVAVGEDRDGNFVFVVERTGEAEGVVRRRQVELGRPSDAQSIEILGGLEVGEVVATAGVRRLTDGTRVKLLPEAG